MANQVQIVFQASVRGLNQALGRIQSAARSVARRVSQHFRQSGNQSGQGFFRGFSRVVGGVVNLVGRVGQQAGRAMSSGASGVFQAAMSDPRIMAGLVAVAAVTAPIIGSILAGAVTLAFGGAVVGGAFALLISQSKDVKAAWEGTLSDVKKQFADAAKPMLPVLERARQAVGRLGPVFARTFERGLSIAAPAVASFIDRVEDGLTRFANSGGLESMMRGFSDVLNQIDIESFFSSLGSAFNRLGAAVSSNAETIGAAFNMVLGLIVQVVNILTGATKVASLFAGPFETLFEKLGMASDGANGFADALKDVDGAANTAQAAMKGMLQSMEEFAQKTLTGRSSLRDYEQSLDDAAEALKKNGRTLDIHTQKGRDNQAALDGIATSALSVAKGMQDQGKSVQDVAAYLDEARASFINMAVGMGMSRTDAIRLADQMGLTGDAIRRMPKSHTTTLKAKNQTGKPKKEAEGGLRRFASKTWRATLGAANRVGGAVSSATGACKRFASRLYRATLRAVSRTGGALATALRDGYSWAGRVFTATFRIVKQVVSKVWPFANGGVVGANRAAGGGPRSNTVLVGEQGPELVNLAPGSMVTPAGATRQKLNQLGGGGGGSVHVELEWVGGNAGDELMQWLRKSIRVRAGTGPGAVQKALGA